jgi:hypothetical protein
LAVVDVSGHALLGPANAQTRWALERRGVDEPELPRHIRLWRAALQRILRAQLDARGDARIVMG